MAVITYIRQAVLTLATIFSVVVLALSAHIISLTQQYYGVTLTYCALAIAVAAVTLVTLPVMLVVDFIRRGAFTSMIIVELVWLFIVSILWVAAAGETVTEYNFYFPFGCGPANGGACQETQAIEAFSFISFIFILLYTIALFVMAVVAASRGQGVWLSSVKESFGASADPVQQHAMAQYNNSAPPQTPAMYHAGAPVQPQYTGGPTQPIATPGSAVITV